MADDQHPPQKEISFSEAVYKVPELYEIESFSDFKELQGKYGIPDDIWDFLQDANKHKFTDEDEQKLPSFAKKAPKKKRNYVNAFWSVAGVKNDGKEARFIDEDRRYTEAKKLFTKQWEKQRPGATIEEQATYFETTVPSPKDPIDVLCPYIRTKSQLQEDIENFLATQNKHSADEYKKNEESRIYAHPEQDPIYLEHLLEAKKQTRAIYEESIKNGSPLSTDELKNVFLARKLTTLSNFVKTYAEKTEAYARGGDHTLVAVQKLHELEEKKDAKYFDEDARYNVLLELKARQWRQENPEATREHVAGYFRNTTLEKKDAVDALIHITAGEPKVITETKQLLGYIDPKRGETYTENEQTRVYENPWDDPALLSTAARARGKLREFSDKSKTLGKDLTDEQLKRVYFAENLIFLGEFAKQYPEKAKAYIKQGHTLLATAATLQHTPTEADILPFIKQSQATPQPAAPAAKTKQTIQQIVLIPVQETIIQEPEMEEVEEINPEDIAAPNLHEDRIDPFLLSQMSQPEEEQSDESEGDLGEDYSRQNQSLRERYQRNLQKYKQRNLQGKSAGRAGAGEAGSAGEAAGSGMEGLGNAANLAKGLGGAGQGGAAAQAGTLVAEGAGAVEGGGALIIAAIVFIILLLLILILMLIFSIAGGNKKADQTEVPPVTITKSGPDVVGNCSPNPSLCEIRYVLNVSFPGIADDVIVRDPIPANTTFVSATGNYTLNGNIIEWRLRDNMTGGATTTPTLPAGTTPEPTQEPTRVDPQKYTRAPYNLPQPTPEQRPELLYPPNVMEKLNRLGNYVGKHQQYLISVVKNQNPMYVDPFLSVMWSGAIEGSYGNNYSWNCRDLPGSQNKVNLGCRGGYYSGGWQVSYGIQVAEAVSSLADDFNQVYGPGAANNPSKVKEVGQRVIDNSATSPGGKIANPPTFYSDTIRNLITQAGQIGRDRAITPENMAAQQAIAVLLMDPELGAVVISRRVAANISSRDDWAGTMRGWGSYYQNNMQRFSNRMSSIASLYTGALSGGSTIGGSFPPAAFTITVRPNTSDTYVYNLASAEVINGRPGDAITGTPEPTRPPEQNGDQPSDNTCDGTYDISQNIMYKNFGDPICSLAKGSKPAAQLIEDYIKSKDNKNAAKWIQGILPCTAPELNPNHYSVGADSSHRWGLFLMGESTAGPGKPGIGPNGTYDRGDVSWQKQIDNAIQYNKDLAGRGQEWQYWSQCGVQ